MRAALLALATACTKPVAPPTTTPPPPRVVAATTAPVDAAEPTDADEPDAQMGEDYDETAPKFPVEKVTLGPLRIRMTEKEVLTAVGAPKTKSKPELMGAYGMFQSDWEYGDLDLQMMASTAKGPFNVTAISFSGARPYKTPEGIGIGSTRAEITAVYGKYIGHTNDKSSVLVGSIYFGLLFSLEDERVAGVFLGAMAF
jgi:hypothetical protein